MGIRFLCEACGKKLNVKDNLAGKKGRCPKCNEKILIPTESILEKAVDDKVIASVGETPNRDKSDLNRSEGQSAKAQVKNVATKPLPEVPTPSTPKPDSLGKKRKKTAQKPEPDRVSSKHISSGADVPEIPKTANTPTSEKQVPNVPPVPNSQEAESEASQMDSAFDQAPDASWFVRPVSGGQFGPADAHAMKSWLSEGRVGRDSLVWREGWEEWENAEKIFKLEFQGATAGSGPKPEPDQTSQSTSSSNIAYHQRARQKAKTMGIILIVALVLLTIVLGVLLVLVANGTIGGVSSTNDDSEALNVLPLSAETANVASNRLQSL